MGINFTVFNDVKVEPSDKSEWMRARERERKRERGGKKQGETGYCGIYY